MKRGSRRAVVLAAVVTLGLGGCGVQDRATVSAETERLRDEVRRVVADARARVADRVDLTPDLLTGALVSEIPPEPEGHRLGESVPPVTSRPEVSFALDGKVDGIGPGQETQVLRMCVRVTFLGATSLDSTVDDTDCSALPTRAQIVKFDA